MEMSKSYGSQYQTLLTISSKQGLESQQDNSMQLDLREASNIWVLQTGPNVDGSKSTGLIKPIIIEDGPSVVIVNIKPPLLKMVILTFDNKPAHRHHLCQVLMELM